MFCPATENKSEKCPVQDDVPKVYKKMKEADVIVLAVPTYSGKAASLYCAFAERAQRIKDYEEFKDTILNKVIALIVIRNIPAGGDLAYHTVVLDHHDCKYPPSSVLLQAAGYGQSSIHGTLNRDEKVRDRLDNLVESILKTWNDTCRISRSQ